MLKPIAARMRRWRFERPLALLLAAAAAFAVLARAGSSPVSWAIALAVAALAALIADRAMRRPPVIAPRRAAAPVKEAVISAGQAEPVPEHRLVRLRRADRHPDAPAREPIRAHRELGSPLMEIDAEPLPRRAPDTAFDEPEAMPAPVASEAEPETAANEPAAAVEPQAATDRPIPRIVPVPANDRPETVPADDPIVVPIAAFAPDPGPVPMPVRPARPSLAEMMDRLSTGLETRAAAGRTAPSGPPPALRDALLELNRLAARAR